MLNAAKHLRGLGMSTVGARIREAREAAGLTQKELGEKCDWGEEAQSRVSHYERNKREPTLAELERMAKALGVQASHLAFDAATIPPEEFKLLRAYRRSNSDGRELIHRAAQVAAPAPQQKRRKRAGK